MADDRNSVSMKLKIAFSVFGVLAGCCVFFVFTFLYQNYHAGLWALLSCALSSIVLHQHLLFRNNRLEHWHTIHSLTALRNLGILTLLCSTGDKMSSSEDEIPRRKKSVDGAQSRSRSRSKEEDGSEDEEDEYEVEEIRDKKLKNGTWVYYIKWVGWESDTNTWEPKEHLDCPDKLEDFERKWKRKEEKREQRRREERERKIKDREEREKRRDEKLEKRKLESSDSDSETETKPVKVQSRRESEDKQKVKEKEKKEEKVKIRKIESSLFKTDKLMKDNRIEKERKKDDRKDKDDKKEKEGRKEKDERKEKGRMTKEIPVKILGMTKEAGTNYFIVRFRTDETGLMTMSDAHDFVPKLCCQFYSEFIEIS
ncbi:histone-lysine N-methyltransferase, H3 lysine-79 specific [Eurytemora carolleeae]|uniref:histone-lysine N-methyltransferase, H3 lysine-79 specific n=1 Tax=Eurytemora carolleeae TaxID=1294199 RepID=UPI000C794918|nr:histone-lysine N-methyltransferase, H3 lysine-79 specific [Eurytemora carolleeae]|eukprot:XP_023319914.1 histone-lysine N-methyltransferase, H3 lysine-79 specific-like [Eurytemora affinis]